MNYREKLVEAAINAYFACLASMNSRNIAYWHKLMGEVIGAGLFSEYCEAKQMENCRIRQLESLRISGRETV